MTSALVAYCHPGTVDAHFHESLIKFLMHDAKGPGHVMREGDVLSFGTGPRIASARNNVVRQFLRHPRSPEYLWFLDVDMVFAPDTLDRLLDVADPDTAPIVGGLCFGGGRGGDIFPTLYRMVGSTVEKITEYPRDALVTVDGTGGACILIHRSVLESMAERFPEPFPWFAEGAHFGLEIGEDMAFCLRARTMDIPIHVHTGIRIGHVKPAVLDERAFEEHQARVAVLGQEAVTRMRYEELKMIPEVV